MFNPEDWKIMNMDWSEFSCLTTIVESDFWGQDIKTSDRNIMNAKQIM